MTPTKTVNLLMSEVSFMVKHGYIKVLCDCDNTVYVWRNKNLCDCHRARCLKCKNSKSYFLFSRKLKTGWVSQLSMFSDSYDDYRAALLSTVNREDHFKMLHGQAIKGDTVCQPTPA